MTCHCSFRFPETEWLVSLFHCYIFCGRCSHFVNLPEDLLFKVLSTAQGLKRQNKLFPEAGPRDKFRNGVVRCDDISPSLFHLNDVEGFSCLSCSSSSFAVCLEPFHAFCVDCHVHVSVKSTLPKSQALVGKLWLLAEEASRKVDQTMKS